MYGNYIEYVPLTMENILKRVTQQDIFHILFDNIIMDSAYKYKAPYRNDNTPGCFFSEYNNKLYFVDFANPVHHLDCFNVIELTYKLSFTQTLEFINNHFKLGLGGSVDIIPEKYTLPKKENMSKSTHSTIGFVSKPFSKEDQLFWSSFGISSYNLRFDNVVKAKMLKIYSGKTNRWATIIPKLPTYIYTEFYPRLKVYTPYADKKHKWISNVTKNDIGNINNLPFYSDLLVITKSYKDARLLRNYGILTVWFQSEGVIPDEEILYSLIKRFDNVIVFYDNDKQGIKASSLLTQVLNSIIPSKATSVHLPQSTNTKDPSDFRKMYGDEKTFKILKILNLL
jgi:hypothetical protein